MSPFMVIGAIVVAVFALWWATKSFGNQDGIKNSIQRENLKLGHIVAEMAMEKHRSHDNSHHRHSR